MKNKTYVLEKQYFEIDKTQDTTYEKLLVYSKVGIPPPSNCTVMLHILV